MTLCELRKQNKTSRSEVAKELNITCNAVSNYENGIRCINIEQVIPLARLLDCTAEEVIQAQLESITIRQTKKEISGNVE